MSPWLDDHLHCAAPAEWLPSLVAQRRARRVGTAPPRALRRVLDGCAPLEDDDDTDASLDVLVCCGELWQPLAATPSAVARLGDGGVLVDLAWVGGWSATWTLQAWRRAPGQRAAAERLAGVVALGLREPQQWVSAARPAAVITLALARG